jgi:hypothetical protein
MYGTLIASSTLGAGGVSSIDFTSIPATYTDLFVVLSARANGAGNSRLNLNGSAASFLNKVIYSNGASAPLTFSGTLDIGRVTSTSDQANNFGAMQIHIPNYLSSVAKPYSVEAFAANYNGGWVMIVAGVWQNTAAITSVSLLPPSGNTFEANTSAYLYGVLVGSGGATVTAT